MSDYSDHYLAVDRAMQLVPGRWDSEVVRDAADHLDRRTRRDLIEWGDTDDEARHLTIVLLLWLARRQSGEQAAPGRAAWLLLALLVLQAMPATASAGSHQPAAALAPVPGDSYARTLVIAPGAPPVPALIAGARG